MSCDREAGSVEGQRRRAAAAAAANEFEVVLAARRGKQPKHYRPRARFAQTLAAIADLNGPKAVAVELGKTSPANRIAEVASSIQ